MFKSLEELRSQRKIIQAHLNWLDTQIKHLEENDDSPEPTTIRSAAEAQTEEKDYREQSNKEPASQLSHSIEDVFIRSSGATDIKRAQVGCFIVFIVATLLFLSLLFVLPYFL